VAALRAASKVPCLVGPDSRRELERERGRERVGEGESAGSRVVPVLDCWTTSQRPALSLTLSTAYGPTRQPGSFASSAAPQQGARSLPNRANKYMYIYM